MKIVSIDIETTGLSPEENQIIEFGAVLFDDASPEFRIISVFHRYVIHSILKGSYVALIGNVEILKKTIECSKQHADDAEHVGMIHNMYSTSEVVTNEDSLLKEFNDWLHLEEAKTQQYGKFGLNILGKNFSTFDMRFLEKLDGFRSLNIRKRVLDVAQLYYVVGEDTALPDLKTCKRRSGIFANDIVAHTALEDATETAMLWHHGIHKHI